MEYFWMIVIGIILILGACISYLFIFFMGPVVIILYIISMISMVACFALIKDKVVKFVSTGLIAFAFACVYFVNLQSGVTDDPKDIAVWAVMTFTYMVPRYYIGKWIAENRAASKEKKQEKKKVEIEKEIECLNSENEKLRTQIFSHSRELLLLDLLDKCGGYTAVITESHQFGSVVRMKEKIEINKERIIELETQLMNISVGR